MGVTVVDPESVLTGISFKSPLFNRDKGDERDKELFLLNGCPLLPGDTWMFQSLEKSPLLDGAGRGLFLYLQKVVAGCSYR